MGQRIIEERNIRNLTKNNSGTYSISLPIEFVRKLGWHQRQKLVIKRRGKQLIIEDWGR